jgi:hypothetical protein
MATKRKPWTHPELPWLVVGGIVLVLALIDRFFITNQSSSIDRLLDWATIISAIVGSGYSWVASYRTSLRTTQEPGAILVIRILVCWLLGPFFVLGAACFAHDIDGGLLLFYPPFFGILLTTFVLPFLLTRRWARFAKLNPKPTSPTANPGQRPAARINETA